MALLNTLSVGHSPSLGLIIATIVLALIAATPRIIRALAVRRQAIDAGQVARTLAAAQARAIASTCGICLESQSVPNVTARRRSSVVAADAAIPEPDPRCRVETTAASPSGSFP
jgi:hypothetical protein